MISRQDQRQNWLAQCSGLQLHQPAALLLSHGLPGRSWEDTVVRCWLRQDDRPFPHHRYFAQPGNSVSKDVGADSFSRLHLGHNIQHQHFFEHRVCLFFITGNSSHQLSTALKTGDLFGQQVEFDNLFIAILRSQLSNKKSRNRPQFCPESTHFTENLLLVVGRVWKIGRLQGYHWFLKEFAVWVAEY